MSKIINDEFLSAYMPQAECLMLDRIPPENELSHQFSNRFNRKMKVLLKYERRTPAMRRFVHQMKAIAAILLIFLSMIFGTVMSVEAYRVRFFEYVTEIWEELTSIVIHSDDNADHDTLVPIAPSYIPDGFDIFEQLSNKYENTIIYCNEDGSEIYYSQKLATQSEFILDSENAEVDTVTIEMQTAYVLINKGTVQIYWHDEFNVFSLIGGLDKTELINMAESIIKR